ncbi:hypothetical protein OQA88_936 [Cercophora sp. LCS_1]
MDGGVGSWVLRFKGNPQRTDKDYLSQFAGPEDSRVLEFKSDPNGTSKYLNDELGSNVNIEEWLDPAKFGPDVTRGILRLAILPLNTDTASKPPISWSGVRSHLELLNLSPPFISSDRIHAPPSWFEIPLEGGFKGFMIKQARWDADLTNFSLWVAYCPVRRVTLAVAHMLHKAAIDTLVARLRTLRSMAWHPLMVPLVLMEPRVEDIAASLDNPDPSAPADRDIRGATYAAEKRIGTHKNYIGASYHKQRNHHAYGPKIWEIGDDFAAVPGIFTSVISECVMIESRCLHDEALLDWLAKLNADLLHRQDTTDPLRALSRDSIRIKISAMKTWAANNRTRAVYFSKRAEAQMQASLSLMAMRDNHLNYQSSQAAVRDSADMRTIAWVTLLFLPATFVAVYLLQHHFL